MIDRALRDPEITGLADFRLIGPTREGRGAPTVERESVGEWAAEGGEELAGRISAAAIERGAELARLGELDGLVTGPISKRALFAAGYDYPGHTELLRDLAGVPEVTMMMTAERTPLGGPLRLALVTAHVAYRAVPKLLTTELVVERAALAVAALRGWWGIERPRLCIAGLNPHASESGLFGDEEARVLEPAAGRLADECGIERPGVVPADTAFLRCVEGEVDVVVTPTHDVGLAVLKTLARDDGVNVTAGLPYPRTSPDHGTAFDIAGAGLANPGAMKAAIRLCSRFADLAVEAR